MSTPAKIFPTWAFFSLVINAILVLAVTLLVLRQQGSTAFFRFPHTATPVKYNKPQVKTAQVTLELGPRHKLNYQQWVDILEKEGKAAALKPQEHLSILAGDSLSLWFPTELLPENRNWLNQGISGETSDGLLKRLNLFDRTQPTTIFVMIGINDLIQGASDRTILDNQQQIISYLRRVHPKTQIVVQSILPHGQEKVTWERREKLLAIPNSRIRKLNQQLQDITKKEGVKYLNLHPLFTNKQGDLRSEFSTDGLHLSSQGYLVWRSALGMYTQIELGE